MIELAPYQLKALLEDCAKLATLRTLCELGKLKPYLSKSEAYKKYGRGVVDRWIQETLIIPIQDGIKTTIRLDRLELESLSMSANRNSWFSKTYKDRDA